ncbi:hypothetical protein [Nocardia pseudovaccinii]|uniref:hypothetical protein n=1 Tax=Nocardia pseudovaccinii TaxID=189540 RepID=UPI0007A48700|nr:hypothetical protein [Nocardia pseudovaccinii]
MNRNLFQLQSAVDTLGGWLTDADRVLVTAGAGLTAAAGYDYGDADRFRELFPALFRMGLRSRYTVGVRLPPALRWGYWAVHINDIRFAPAPNPLYQRLRVLIGDKDHWAVTSNVDALFARNGFAADRILTRQGDYGRYQCSVPCTSATWDSKALVDRLLTAYDPATGTVDPTAVPLCPNCASEVEINVRVGPQFVDAPYVSARRRLSRWLHTAPADTKLLIMEFGAGFNTPGVIRWPGEQLARDFPYSRFARINPSDAETPAELAGRALPVRAGAAELLEALTIFDR